jgi:hypothetical protein
VECKVVESGNYSLEIVDLSGGVIKIKEWQTNLKEQTIFLFEIPVINYGNGSYIILMNTPTKQYTTKFIIKR